MELGIPHLVAGVVFGIFMTTLIIAISWIEKPNNFAICALDNVHPRAENHIFYLTVFRLAAFGLFSVMASGISMLLFWLPENWGHSGR